MCFSFCRERVSSFGLRFRPSSLAARTFFDGAFSVELQHVVLLRLQPDRDRVARVRLLRDKKPQRCHSALGALHGGQSFLHGLERRGLFSGRDLVLLRDELPIRCRAPLRVFCAPSRPRDAVLFSPRFFLRRGRRRAWRPPPQPVDRRRSEAPNLVLRGLRRSRGVVDDGRRLFFVFRSGAIVDCCVLWSLLVLLLLLAREHVLGEQDIGLAFLGRHFAFALLRHLNVVGLKRGRNGLVRLDDRLEVG